MRFVVLSWLLSLSAIGCGGSSSETPPPLQPDPTSARYTGPRMPNPADDADPPAAAEPEEGAEQDQPRRPAAATWGSGKAPHPAPALQPSMTSPNAIAPKPAAPAAPAPSAPAAPAH